MTECFVISANEIKKRIDAFYYSKKFRSIIKIDKKTDLVEFRELIALITKGETPLWRGDSYLTEGIPFLKVQDISEEGIKGDIAYISKQVHERMQRSKLFGGELLYTMAGTIGIAVLFPEKIGEANINQAIAKIILNRGVNYKYIKVILNTSFCKLQAQRYLTTSAQPNINFEQIKSIEIPLQSMEIQDRIVQLMDNAYNKKKQKETEALKLFNSVNGYILDELGIKISEMQEKKCYIVNFEKVQNSRLNPYYYQPIFTEAKESLKKGKYKIENLKKFITKIHYGVSIKNEYLEKGIPLLRIMNLKPNKIDITDVVMLDESKRKEIGSGFVYEGDLLISRSGSVGIVAVVPKEAKGFAFGSFMIKFCINNEVNKEYIAIWLNSKISQLFTKQEKIGAIQGNITIETIENFEIPFPPLEIQNKITSEIKARTEKSEKLQKEAKEELKKAKEEVEKIILE